MGSLRSRPVGRGRSGRCGRSSDGWGRDGRSRRRAECAWRMLASWWGCSTPVIWWSRVRRGGGYREAPSCRSSRRSRVQRRCQPGWAESPLRDLFQETVEALFEDLRQRGGSIDIAQACALAWEMVTARYMLEDASEQQLTLWRGVDDSDGGAGL